MERIAICALGVGLIFPFTQVARGQQARHVQPPSSGAVAQNSSGGLPHRMLRTPIIRLLR
jgi:hypothetical protein